MIRRFQTSNGVLEVPDFYIDAVVRHSARLADLTIAVLETIVASCDGEIRRSALRLPKQVLLELAAVIQLSVWENSRARDFLKADLPSFQDASSGLLLRAQEGLKCFEEPHPLDIRFKVFVAWIENFAMDASAISGVDVVVGDFDEDEFIESMANFLWNNRAKMLRLLEGNEL